MVWWVVAGDAPRWHTSPAWKWAASAGCLARMTESGPCHAWAASLQQPGTPLPTQPLQLQAPPKNNNADTVRPLSAPPARPAAARVSSAPGQPECAAQGAAPHPLLPQWRGYGVGSLGLALQGGRTSPSPPSPCWGIRFSRRMSLGAALPQDTHVPVLQRGRQLASSPLPSGRQQPASHCRGRAALGLLRRHTGGAAALGC